MIRLLLTTVLLALPGAATAQIRMLDCSRSSDPAWCQSAQEQYQRERSQAGSYNAMRNEAFCLATGCDGAFVRDMRASCVIRRQIMDKHRRQVDRSDEMHFASCVNAGL